MREDFFLGGSFRNLEDLNLQFRAWLDQVANPRTHATTRRVVAEHFAEELPHLQALPAGPFQAVLQLERRITRDGMISLHGNLYSVPNAVSGTPDRSLTGDGNPVKLMLAAFAADALGDAIDGPLHQSCMPPYPLCFQDQAGTTPRTTRNIMGNDRGPSGNPTRYPARTCCSIVPRASSESAIKGPETLPWPPVNVAQ